MSNATSTRPKSAVEAYETRYSQGGWKYDYRRERQKLTRIVDSLGLKPGDAALEIGCGEGFHAGILYDLGFRVTGNDLSEVGIQNADMRFPTIRFIHRNSLELCDMLPSNHFDMLLARGHSWYHYELTARNSKGWNVPENTRRMFSLIRPGGFFVLCIRTDFSGTYYTDGVLNNTYQAYRDLFEPLGDVVLMTDANGVPLANDQEARQSKCDVVIATQRLTVSSTV
jgi:SAM-dependent methyltransferase